MNLDHVNIRVQNLERMCSFYQDVLDLKVGYRPPFPGSPGAWLYDSAGNPVVHLSTSTTPNNQTGPSLGHIAFRTNELSNVVNRLKSNGIEFEIEEVPETQLIQIFFNDPEGGRVEVCSATQLSQIAEQPGRSQ